MIRASDIVAIGIDLNRKLTGGIGCERNNTVDIAVATGAALTTNRFIALSITIGLRLHRLGKPFPLMFSHHLTTWSMI